MVHTGNIDEVFLAEKPVSKSYYALEAAVESSTPIGGGSGAFGGTTLQEVMDARIKSINLLKYTAKATDTKADGSVVNSTYMPLHKDNNYRISEVPEIVHYGNFLDATNLTKIPYTEEAMKNTYLLPLLQPDGQQFKPINTKECLIGEVYYNEGIIGNTSEESLKQSVIENGIRDFNTLDWKYNAKAVIDFSTQMVAINWKPPFVIAIPRFSLFINVNGTTKLANTLCRAFYNIEDALFHHWEIRNIDIGYYPYSQAYSPFIKKGIVHSVRAGSPTMNKVINKIPYLLIASTIFGHIRDEFNRVEVLALAYKDENGTIHGELTNDSMPQECTEYASNIEMNKDNPIDHYRIYNK